MPCRMSDERIHRRMIPNKVTVLFSLCIEPGVKVLVGGGRRDNPNVRWQPRIQCQRQFAGG